MLCDNVLKIKNFMAKLNLRCGREFDAVSGRISNPVAKSGRKSRFRIQSQIRLRISSNKFGRQFDSGTEQKVEDSLGDTDTGRLVQHWKL
jgi:hypothetical protein